MVGIIVEENVSNAFTLALIVIPQNIVELVELMLIKDRNLLLVIAYMETIMKMVLKVGVQNVLPHVFVVKN